MPKSMRKRNAARRATAFPHTPQFSPVVSASPGAAAQGKRIGFPASRTASFTYVENLQITSTAGALGYYQFKLNDAYDPNYTGTGHQPMGYDQWALFYNHYVVEACTYDIEAIKDATAGALLVGTYLSDDTTTQPSAPSLCEGGGAFALVNERTEPHIFRGRVDVAKFFNRTNIASDPDLRALVTTSPADHVFLTLVCQPSAGATTTHVVDFIIKLTMRIRFMEPKDLEPSRNLMTAALLLRGTPPDSSRVTQVDRESPAQPGRDDNPPIAPEGWMVLRDPRAASSASGRL